MVTRTLYFGNPAYLSLKEEQLVVQFSKLAAPAEKMTPLQKRVLQEAISATIPIEDIGLMVLDHSQITLTQALLSRLIDQNIAIISCNEQHLPTGMFLPLEGHTKQTKIFQFQIKASEPLKKQLWQTTIREKIHNQAGLLQKHRLPYQFLKQLSEQVKSGDKENKEAFAAQYYWKILSNVFGATTTFRRERYGEPPNNYLNFGYAILRGIVARNLVGSGLLPSLGIFHHNQYNAFCLADDIMEPYRPMVDDLVIELVKEYGLVENLNKEIKAKLLELPTIDTLFRDKKSPLMVAIQNTTASLAKSFQNNTNQLSYANII